MRSIPAGIAWGLVALLVLGAAFALGRCSADPGPAAVRTVVDTAGAAAWRERAIAAADELQEERTVVGRLTERLRGIERRGPERIVVYDTIVDFRRDTVMVAIGQDRRGEVEIVGALPQDTAGMRQPVTIELGDLRRCDYGWTIGADGTVVCRRPPLGRLYLVARGGILSSAPENITASITPAIAAGLHWRPYERSPWGAWLTADQDARIRLEVERRWAVW